MPDSFGSFRIPDPPEGFPAEALEVRSSIAYERGRWVVYLEVVFWDETRRYAIQSYHSERLATIAADWMVRAAQRDLPHPPTGF
jgi:hypothetical protein